MSRCYITYVEGAGGLSQLICWKILDNSNNPWYSAF